MFLSNCRVSILRGTITDSFGDLKDQDSPTYTGIVASIREVRSDTTTISEGTPRQVRFLVGRLPEGTDVRYEDRLRDEETGHIYVVDAVDLDSRSVFMQSGVRLDLRKVS